MPIHFHIDPEKALLEATLSGVISTEDIMGALERILASPEIRPGLRILTDHRTLERAATFEQVDAVLDRLDSEAARLREARWAIVTGHPDSYGMMRVLSTLAELRNSLEVRVFTDLEPAEVWLGLRAQSLSRV